MNKQLHASEEDATSFLGIDTPSDLRWSFTHLETICERKGIILRQSQALKKLRAFTVQYDHVVIISVRASLAEAEMIGVLGHELGHYALGHTGDTEALKHDTFVAFQRDPAKEREARIWAAHLLVSPRVYEDCLRGTRVTTRTEEAAQADAAILTARSLGIPQSLVDLWRDTQSHHFEEHPYEWIRHP